MLIIFMKRTLLSREKQKIILQKEIIYVLQAIAERGFVGEIYNLGTYFEMNGMYNYFRISKFE